MVTVKMFLILDDERHVYSSPLYDFETTRELFKYEGMFNAYCNNNSADRFINLLEELEEFTDDEEKSYTKLDPKDFYSRSSYGSSDSLISFQEILSSDKKKREEIFNASVILIKNMSDKFIAVLETYTTHDPKNSVRDEALKGFVVERNMTMKIVSGMVEGFGTYKLV